MPAISTAKRSLGISIHLTPALLPVDQRHAHQNHHVVYRHASNLNRQKQGVHNRESITFTKKMNSNNNNNNINNNINNDGNHDDDNDNDNDKRQQTCRHP